MSEPEARGLAEVLRALAEPTRLQIIAALSAHPGLAVVELAEVIGMAEPTTAHHARLLNRAGVVVAGEPEWPFVPLHLAESPLVELADAVRALDRPGSRHG